MSHSTHVGFNCPPSVDMIAWSNRSPERSLPFFRVSEAGDEPLCIDAVGVGQFFAKAGSPFLGFVVSKLPRFKASFARGVGIGPKKFRGERPAERSATAFVLLASGVGNNPDPVSSVRRTNGARWNAMPFRVIPDLGQVPENGVQPSTKQSCHVLKHRVSRSYHANGSNHFPVESRTGSGKSGAVTGKGYVLAGETGRDNISAFLELVLRHVRVDGHTGEALGQDALRKRVDLAEGDGLEPTRTVKPKREAADTREQVDDAQLAHCIPAASSWGVRNDMRT